MVLETWCGEDLIFKFELLNGYWRRYVGLPLHCQIDSLDPCRKTKRVSNPKYLLGGGRMPCK